MLKIVLIFFATCLFIRVHASITIDIEPEELQQLGEILVQSYLERGIHSIASVNNAVFTCKKVSLAIIQLIGIMFTLVGANILTELLNNANKQRYGAPLYIENVTNITPTRMCDNDFGCNRNMCWRTCNVDLTGDEPMFSWCYTKPDESDKNLHSCQEANECSPCWSCFGPCHFQPEI